MSVELIMNTDQQGETVTEDTERRRMVPIKPEKEDLPPIDYRMRASQLASTVRQGRKIGISVLDEGVFEGYLTAWDDETYFLVVPDNKRGVVEKVLIPKASVLFIQMYDERSFRDEPLYDEMEQLVKSFRGYINNNYFKPAS